MISKKLKSKYRHNSILHLGCGKNKYPNSIGVDINPEINADIIHDLNQFPYPFKNNQFSEVIAEHILEHLDNIPKVLSEIHRITMSDGRLIIISPHFTSMDSFTDPTHKHFFTSMSFDYFIPGTSHFKLRYSNVKFKKNLVIAGPTVVNPLLKFILFLINKNLLWYEKRFAFIFPVGVIRFELGVIK